MAKAVFMTAAVSRYDDLPEYRYHFPRTYLNTVRRAHGDWIVYYEPRRPPGGRQSYFATARVEEIKPDREREGHYYAYVRDYLEFARPVPFRESGFYYESQLQKNDGSTNKGRFGRSVRQLKNTEYDLILTAGFQPLADPATQSSVHERPIISQLSQRPFRDRAFTSSIRRAYNDTCAVSGLHILNGGGRCEAQAAHIQPVAHNGPDCMRNGLALSATVHWMFDRGLISIDDNYTLLLKRASIPDNVLRLINEDRRLTLPDSPSLHPHRRYLEYHRQHVFKG